MNDPRFKHPDPHYVSNGIANAKQEQHPDHFFLRLFEFDQILLQWCFTFLHMFCHVKKSVLQWCFFGFLSRNKKMFYRGKRRALQRVRVSYRENIFQQWCLINGRGERHLYFLYFKKLNTYYYYPQSKFTKPNEFTEFFS